MHIVYWIALGALCLAGVSARLIVAGSRLAWVALLVAGISFLFASTFGYLGLIYSSGMVLIAVAEVWLRRSRAGRA